VLDAIARFVSTYPAASPLLDGRLAVSNIAWEAAEEKAVLQVLAMKGVSSIEVAPAKLYGMDYAVTDEKTAAFKAAVEGAGLAVSSLQAILFQCPQCTLFDSDEGRAATMAQAQKMIDVAAALGARTIVWGSPKQRKIGDRAYAECFGEAVAFFQGLGAYAASKGVVIAMEANAREYGCDFCFTVDQAAQLVRAVGSEGMRLHLDAACMHMEGDDFLAAVLRHRAIVCSVQVSEPQLGTFEEPQVNHSFFAAALASLDASVVVSIEMRAHGSNLRHVCQAVDLVQRVYRKP